MKTLALRKSLLAWTILAAASAALADAPSAAGRWSGSIELPGQSLVVDVQLSSLAGGAWTGSIDIPAQGARGLALTGFRVEGSAVRFSISGVPGDPTFDGRLSSDGGSIAGEFTQGGQKFPFRLTRKVEATGAPAAETPSPGALDGFDAFVEKALKEWKVPGLAVAIVKDGQVVLAKGYGLRNVAKNLPVTADTIFAIGSTTKAFTAMTLAMLVDDGRLDWDKPVRTYLPSFQVEDVVASERMTPRDLVTHRSGLPRHDLMWYAAPLSRKEIFDRLRYLEPNADFRAKWQYQNLMFMTAGYLAGEVAGMSWEDIVRRRIFGPLGMTSSNLSVEESKKAADYALPYHENDQDKTVREIAFRNIDAVGPAGAINSNVTDMAKWARLHLSDGTVDGQRIVSRGNLEEMHRPQMVMPETGPDPEIVLPSYGLGWAINSYRGKKRVWHSGGIDGFTAMVTVLPAEKLGVVVLSNKDGTSLPEIVTRVALDRMLGLPPIDWDARIKARSDEEEKAAEKATGGLETFEHKKGTKPAHALDEYTGDYEHPAYGTVTVSRDGAANLEVRFHGIPMKLEHWHYETFRANPTDPALAEEKLFVLFRTNTKGDVDSLTMPLESQVADIVFTKKPPARLSDPAFLKTMTGTYVLVDQPSVTVSVALEGDALVADVTGQPQYHLEPYRGTEFRFRELTGYSIRFLPDTKGTVNELLVVQPDGVYRATRKK